MRANDSQRNIIADIFARGVTDCDTECLFHPDLKLAYTQRAGSLLEHMDIALFHFPKCGRQIAR